MPPGRLAVTVWALAEHVRPSSSMSMATAISTSSPTSSTRRRWCSSVICRRRRALRYLEITLTGTTSNRNGLGAVVKVTAGGTTQTKVMDGNSGYLSHSRCQLHSDSNADVVDSIEVQWPSGKKQVVQPPFKLNSRIDARAVSKATALRRK